MYESYYGFKANPFRIAPDPSFFFASAGHKRGLAYLRYGLHQGQGFVVVTGEPGTGKTMLVQTLLSELSSKDYRVATISNTNLRADDVLRAVAENFGIEQRDARNKAELLTFIQKFLHEQHTEGKKSLLIIDEAQNLPPRSLEELRMLSNFQIGHEGLLQIVLAGQPQLRKTLAAPSMEQLSQRIIAGCHLKPISAVETRAYISHRMRRVGWSGVPNFSGEALSLIFQMSRGIPRLINIFVDRLLLASALEEKSSVDEARVRSVLDELRHENHGAWNDADLDGHISVELALSPLPESSSSAGAHSTQRPVVAREASSMKTQAGVATGVPRKAVKSKPRIVKAVASGGHGGKAQAAQLVQVKWPKRVAAEVNMTPTAPAKQRTREQVKAEMLAATKKKQIAELAAREKEDTPVVSVPTSAKPQRDPNVIDLPLPNKQKSLDEGGAELGDGFQMIDAAATPSAPPSAERDSDTNTSLVEEINARSDDDTIVLADAPALSADPDDHRDVFVDEKRGQSSLLWIMVVGVLVIGGAIFAYLSMGSNDEVSAPVDVGANGEVDDALLKSMFTPPSESTALKEVGGQVGVPVIAKVASDSMSEPVPEWELADLMYTFILAYENGNVSLFSTLFSGKAKMDGHSGRNQITSYYEKLFQETEMRSMAVNNIKWSAGGDKIHGEGSFELNHWYKGKDRPDTKSGQFVIDVVRANNRLQIFQVKYVDV